MRESWRKDLWRENERKEKDGNFPEQEKQKMTFYEKMRVVCLAIPDGKVATYGQIALLCGKPKNSRQVGYGLRNQLAGSDVPAFRIVNGKGELSGASHFQIPGLQKMLLEEDGIKVFWNGSNWSVDLREYGWNHSIEEADAFGKQFEDNVQQGSDGVAL